MAPISAPGSPSASAARHWADSLIDSDDKDTFETLLRELGIEGSDIIREEFARSRGYGPYRRQRFREKFVSDQSSTCPKGADCSKRLYRFVYGHRRHHEPVPSELLDEGEADNSEAEQGQRDQFLDSLHDEDNFDDVYRDCHYHRGSPYGYLVNRCPDFPLSVSMYGYHHAHLSSLDQHIRYDDILLAPGMILPAMLVLLLTSIIIVEVADLIWKQRRANAQCGQRSTTIFKDYMPPLLPQLESDDARRRSDSVDTQEEHEVEDRII